MEQWAAMFAATSVMGIEGVRECCSFTPLPTFPVGIENRPP